MSVNLLKKMSAATVIGQKIASVVKEHLGGDDKKDGGTLDLYTVFGIANGIKTGEHATNGAWVAFTGNFEANNHLDGSVARSGVVFAPAPMDSMLQSALTENASVSFSFTVTVKRRDDLAVGYEYIVKPHVETSEADPLAHLRQQTQNLLAAPEAPAPEAKKGTKK